MDSTPGSPIAGKPQRRRRARDAGAGVGLVDTLLAVTVLAMLAAVPVLVFDSSPFRLDGAARAVVADMLEAQSLAIETRMPIGVRFDPGSNRYEFILDDGRTPAQAETSLRADRNLSDVEVERLLDARAYGDPELPDAVIVGAAFGGRPAVIFEVDGAPRADGLVDIELDSVVRRVRVQAGSGRIVVTEP